MIYIDDNWSPTADNINELPEPVRQYIYDLETMAGPAGLVRENAFLNDLVQELVLMIRELRGR